MEKKSEFLGPPTLRGLHPTPFAAPFLWARRPHPSKPSPFFWVWALTSLGRKNEHTEETFFVLSPCFFFSPFFFFLLRCFFLSRLLIFVLSRMSFFLSRCVFVSRDPHLHLPLPLSNRICGCARPLDSHGHHRAACGRTGVLGGRGFRLESAAARRGCSGGWLPVLDVWRWSQVDCLLCEAMRNPRRGASTRGCVALTEARSQGERVYPKLGRAWSAGASWHWRLEADGPPRPLTSCLNSQKPRPAANVLGASTHGAGVAVEV